MTPAQIESTAAAFRHWLEHRDPTRLEYLGPHRRWEQSATPVFDLGYVCRVAPHQSKPSHEPKAPHEDKSLSKDKPLSGVNPPSEDKPEACRTVAGGLSEATPPEHASQRNAHPGGGAGNHQ